MFFVGVISGVLPGSSLFPYTTLFRSSEDRVWLVETGVSPNMFVGFDTRNEEFISSTPVESGGGTVRDRKSTRLNSSHVAISYAVFCLKKKTNARDVKFFVNNCKYEDL